MKEGVWNSWFPRNQMRSRPCRATGGSTRFDQEAEGVGKCGHEQSPIVFSTGRNRLGSVNILGLASLSTFSKLWGLGAVPSCLIPGPQVIRVGG